jgi:predicted nucleic acid-binding protein
VLGAAVAAHAACLVTVDKDLLAKGRHAKVVIIAPRRFWSLAPDI